MPLISAVEALKGHDVKVTWERNGRPGAVDVINLAPLILSFKIYRPLRKDRSLFASVQVADNGNAIAWGDGAIDMSATAIERLAQESMSAADFRTFLEEHRLTQDAAAAVLGRSRRQIANYLAEDGIPIPRVVGLACYGFAARKAGFELAQPDTLPSPSPPQPQPPEMQAKFVHDQLKLESLGGPHVNDAINLFASDFDLAQSAGMSAHTNAVLVSGLIYPLANSGVLRDVRVVKTLNEAPPERILWQNAKIDRASGPRQQTFDPYRERHVR